MTKEEKKLVDTLDLETLKHIEKELKTGTDIQKLYILEVIRKDFHSALPQLDKIITKYQKRVYKK